MPVVKHKAIHVKPQNFINYILNGDKNSDMKYATGINCNVDNCYNEFKQNFEKFSGERFLKHSLDDKSEEELSKERIRLHHYIQSFKPDEISPELAHQLGIEWAKKAFGENRKIVVSTHLDRDHIHNHIAVAPYDRNGNLWHDNMETLWNIRKISDEIAKYHGLSVITEPNTSKNNWSYAEYIAKLKKTSWKEKLIDDLNQTVRDENIRSIDDLVKRMEELGYKVTRGKYLSFKSPKAKNGIRSYRLGDGYALEELQYRIKNKDMEMPKSKLEQYSGIQREYAYMLRQMQIVIYQHKPVSYNIRYKHLLKTTDLLNFLFQNNIENRKEFENYVNGKDREYWEKEEDVYNQKMMISEIESIVSNGDRYIELMKKDDLLPHEIEELGKYSFMQMYNITSVTDIDYYKKALDKEKEKLNRLQEIKENAESERRAAGDMLKAYLDEQDKFAPLFTEQPDAPDTTETENFSSGKKEQIHYQSYEQQKQKGYER